MSERMYVPAIVKDAGIEKLMDLVKIEGKFAIVTTIQHLEEVKKLEEKGFKVIGQVLGCNIVSVKNYEDEADAYLYIGTGYFHPLNLSHQTEKPVYILNPTTQKFSLLSDEIKEKYEGRIRGMMAKYYTANKVGVIVSTKSGQNQFPRALIFKKNFEEKYPNKKIYLFMCDNIKNLEDFPDIECWVNTACIRIFEDDLNKPLVNIREVEGKNL